MSAYTLLRRASTSALLILSSACAPLGSERGSPLEVPGDAEMGAGLALHAALSGEDDASRAGEQEEALGLAPHTTFQAAQVCAAGTTVFGIDVSKWQGNINWAQVAGAGVEYAFIRVSDGLTYPDEKFAQNWAGAKQNGVLRGAYQFFRPGQNAIDQANLLLDTMGPLEPDDLPPVIDVEATDGQSASVVAQKVGQWIDHVEAALGVTPIIYTGKYFWQDNVQSSAFSSYPLWHAQYPYQSTPGNDDYVGICPNIANAWSEWAIWQYASTGAVAGISGNVDVNRFNGNLAALGDFTVGQPVCGDGICSSGEAGACAADCPVCEDLPAAGAIVDDGDPCFLTGGSPEFIRYETSAGYGGDLRWTNTWVNATPDNHALWTLGFEAAGDYTVEVYTDAAFAQWEVAVYEVRHGGLTDFVVVDQTAVDGWQTVGTFTFAAGGDQWVRLDDIVDTGAEAGLHIVFDALRVEPAPEPEPDPMPDPEPESAPEPDTSPEPDVAPEPDTSPEPDADPEPETAPEPDTSPEPDVAPEPDVTPEPAPTDGGAEGTSNPQPDPEPEEELPPSVVEGCACVGAVPPSTPVTLWAAAAGVVLGVTSRRRRSGW